MTAPRGLLGVGDSQPSTRAARVDGRITDLFQERFTLSVEIVPNRQRPFDPVSAANADSLQLALSAADFAAVTRNAGGRSDHDNLATAVAISQHTGFPRLCHVTLRHQDKALIETELLRLWELGIRNLLALRGEPLLDGEPVPDASNGYASTLVSQIRDFNLRIGNGCTRARPINNGDAPPSDLQVASRFTIGVSCYPDEHSREKRIDHLGLKADAGAEFAVTQMMLDPQTYPRFVDECRASGITMPILPGVPLMRSREQASRIGKRFAMDIPIDRVRALPATDADASLDPQRAVDNFVQNVNFFAQAGAPGVHLFMMGIDASQAALALEAARATLGAGRF